MEYPVLHTYVGLLIHENLAVSHVGTEIKNELVQCLPTFFLAPFDLSFYNCFPPPPPFIDTGTFEIKLLYFRIVVLYVRL